MSLFSAFSQSQLNFPASLTEEYRPRKIEDFAGLDEAKTIIGNFVKRPVPCAWFFHGESGTGKTSMALAMAYALNAEIHHIPSQECNVQNVQAVIKQCWYVPSQGTFHVVIVDEADKMSEAAQLAFLSRLDATAFPPQTIFVFTSNSPDGLEPRFLSRCRKLKFSTYGLLNEGTALLERIWKEKAGEAEQPNLTQLMKTNGNNIRACLTDLDTKLLAVN